MDRRRLRIPSTSALIAFECVARLQAVGRAAEELNTSQAAISRHLKHLESALGVALFEKAGRGIALTQAGATYLKAVAPALEALDGADRQMRISASDVTVACTHEVSHLILMPEYARLRRELGKGVNIRIMTSEYDGLPAMIHAGADLIFEYSDHPVGGTAIAILEERIIPVAAPAFIEAHALALKQPPSAWNAVPRIALSKSNFGWATWDDWFAAAGAAPVSEASETFDNYVYLLEAAAAGAGLALGWGGFVDRYLRSGALQTVTDDWLTRRPRLFARLTKKGEGNGSAQKFLRLLGAAPDCAEGR